MGVGYSHCIKYCSYMVRKIWMGNRRATANTVVAHQMFSDWRATFLQLGGKGVELIN